MVGAELRDARTRQRLSIDAIADRTKIPVRILRSIDCEDFTSVPGGLARRGFLRAYAKEVGLDPEKTVHRYLAEFEPPPRPGTIEAGIAPDGWRAVLGRGHE